MDQICEEYGLLYTVSELGVIVAASALFCARFMELGEIFWRRLN
jgi:hypothetical protein